MRSLDVFVLPSLAEGLGTVLLEAMGGGAFCCDSRVGGIPELVVDGKTGLLFDPGNKDSLKAALRRAIEEQPLRELGRKNTPEILAHHSVEAMVKMSHEVFSKI